MPIIRGKHNQFHFYNEQMSYIISVFDDRYVLHHYWGKTLPIDIDLTPETEPYYAINFGASPGGYIVPVKDAVGDIRNGEYVINTNASAFDFAWEGMGNFQVPALVAKDCEGCTTSEFLMEDYKIFSGKKKLEGLPATYVDEDSEATTLEIYMVDKFMDLKMVLSYTIFEDYPAITRSVRYENAGSKKVDLLSAKSMCVDLYDDNYSLLHLCGAWGREHQPEIVPLGNLGTKLTTGGRTICNHWQNPFAALLKEGATEDAGDVYGFSLVYSGDFDIDIERANNGFVRVTAGISSHNFDWELGADEIFQTPEVVMVYSDCGLGKMSRTYHKLYSQRLCRGKFRGGNRPVLINNWQATYFDFTEQVLLDIADAGKEVNLDMLVLDDGWFRDDEVDGTGDWEVMKNKLPDGMEGLSEKIKAKGMKFGLWFEPEMVAYYTKTLKEHPDWAINAPGRCRPFARCQFVLDLSREEVYQYIKNKMDSIIESSKLDYIKWDCNRSFCSRTNQMQSHKFILNLYRLLEHFNTKYPDMMIEACSAGGGRMDPGTLYYMPQVQISDNTRARDKVRKTLGLSYVYPMSAVTSKIGAHDVKIGRMDFAAGVGMCANFGCEFDLSTLDEAGKEKLKEYIDFYKTIQDTVLNGDFYRLTGIDSSFTAFQHISPDKKKVYVFVYRTSSAYSTRNLVRLKGLEKGANYIGKTRFGTLICRDTFNGIEMSAEALENIGFWIAGLTEDCAYRIFEFELK